jgi:hypothetical protein
VKSRWRKLYGVSVTSFPHREAASQPLGIFLTFPLPIREEILIAMHDIVQGQGLAGDFVVEGRARCRSGKLIG